MRNNGPPGWEMNSLGNAGVCPVLRPGFACGKKETTGGVAHLRMNNISSDGVPDFSLVRRVPIAVAEGANKWLERGDVLFCNTNSTELVGKSCLFPKHQEQCTFSNHLTQLRADRTTLLPEWLLLCLRQLWLSGYFATNCREFIGQSAFNQDKLREVRIPIPPLPEQQRIVARIEALTARLEQARRLHGEAAAALPALRQAAWDRAFEELPEDQWVPIGTHAKLQGGYAFKSEWFQPRGVRLLRNQNVYHGAIDWSDAVCLPASRRAEFERFRLFEGDIVLSMDRPLISTGLKAARVGKDDLPCLLLQRVGRFICDDAIDRNFLYQFLQTQAFTRDISGDGRSIAVPHISSKQVEAIRIPVPALKRQREIAERLETLRSATDHLARSQAQIAAELESFTPALLAKAFRGEL